MVSVGSLRLLAGGTDDPPRSACYDFVHSIKFQCVSALLILANAIVIGFETDLPDLDCWNYVESGFLLTFTLELFLKIVVIGPSVYFDIKNEDFNSNLFDVSIVSLGLMDASMEFAQSTVNPGGHRSRVMGGATVFRMVRLLRILRIFRIVRFLKQLYMLAFGFAMAAEAVFWVTFLMMFVLYVSSIVLVRTVGHTSTEEDIHGEFLQRKFGTILRSMTTLFELMAVPDVSPYRDVLIHRPLMAVFLVAYVIFGSFGMIALLTGVISEGMFEKNRVRSEEERVDRETVRKILGGRCLELFNNLPHDDDGDAKADDIAQLLPDIGMMFEQNGIVFTHHDLEGMMKFIDADGSGTISRDEFSHFILTMSEGVTPILFHEIFYSVAQLQAKIEDRDGQQRTFEKTALETLQELKGQVQTLSQRSEASVQHANGFAEEPLARLQRCENALSALSTNVDGLRSDIGVLVAQLVQPNQQNQQTGRKNDSSQSSKWGFVSGLGGSRSSSPKTVST